MTNFFYRTPALLMLLTPLLLPAQEKKLAPEDLMNFKLYPKTLTNLQWVTGTENCTWTANNCLVRAGVKAPGKRDTLLRLAVLNDALAAIRTDTLKRFPSVTWEDAGSFSFQHANSLFVYRLAGKELSKRTEWNEKAENLDLHPSGNIAAFTIENNLYVSKDGKTIPVTEDTDKGIVNGSERVHRNEWGIEKGTFWSPSGKLLAFYRMDERMVAEYPLVNTGTRIASLENTRYPMAGETSHQVTVGIYHTETGKTVFLQTGEPKDQFLTNIAWSPDEQSVYIALLNRGQDHMKLNRYDAGSGAFIATLFEEKDPRYVEPMTPMVFMKTRPGQFVWQSRRDGYNHLYLYDVSGRMIRQLTRGAWEVDGFLGFGGKENKLYFLASVESPLEKQLCEVTLKDGSMKQLTKKGYNHFAYINPPREASGSGLYFIDQFNALDVPTTVVVYDGRGKAVDTLLQGENPLKDYRLGETSLLTLKADDGTDLHARMIKPAGFDPGRKYPVIVYVYGGPHSQLVSNTWLGGGNLYFNYLASEGFIVFTLDNRGTANRGFAFESIIHRRLGEIEMKDQLAGIRYLKSLPYTDTTRMAVEGWSYGGFMTLTLMLKNPGLFKVGCAGGPVTDWKYYEVMYGERYMDTPQENPEGYQESSLLNHVKNLQGKLLVIHGTMDATVVWQNSLAFLKKCVEEGKLADYFVYPGHEHNVRGKDRVHLFRKMSQYYKDNL